MPSCHAWIRVVVLLALNIHSAFWMHSKPCHQLKQQQCRFRDSVSLPHAHCPRSGVWPTLWRAFIIQVFLFIYILNLTPCLINLFPDFCAMAFNFETSWNLNWYSVSPYVLALRYLYVNVLVNIYIFFGI